MLLHGCIYIHTYHIFYIYLSIYGHICYLAILNNATMNIRVHVCVRINVFIFFGYRPRSVIARSYGSSIFSFFEETPYCWLHQITFSPTEYEVSLYSTSSLTLFVICGLFDDSHSDRCGFNLHFSDD